MSTETLLDRERALATAHHALDRGCGALLVGVPGAGTSTLAAHLARTHPTRPVVVEDVHLMDDTTFRDRLAGASAGRPVVVTAKTGGILPPSLTSLWSRGELHAVQVVGLREPAVMKLCERHLDGTVPLSTAHVLHRSTDGLPLYLREALQDAADDGQIRRIDGVWVCASPQVHAGRRLADLVRSRTAQLDQGSRRALQVLALAERAPLALLERLAGDETWDDLERLGLIGSVAGSPDQLEIRPPILATAILRSSTTVDLARVRARLLALVTDEATDDPARRAVAHRIAEWRLDQGLEPDPAEALLAVRAAQRRSRHDLVLRIGPSMLDGPFEAPARLALAHSLCRLHRAGEAGEVLRPLLDRARGDAQPCLSDEDTAMLAGLLHHGLGDPEGAVALLEAAVRRADDGRATQLHTQLLVHRADAGALASTVPELCRLYTDPGVDDATRLAIAPTVIVGQTMLGERGRALASASAADALCDRLRADHPSTSAAAKAASAFARLELGQPMPLVDDWLVRDDPDLPPMASPTYQMVAGMRALLSGRVAEATTDLHQASIAMLLDDPMELAPMALAFGVQSAVHAGRPEIALRLRSQFHTAEARVGPTFRHYLRQPLLWSTWSESGVAAVEVAGASLLESCRRAQHSGVELSVSHTLLRLGVAPDAGRIEQLAETVDGWKARAAILHLRSAGTGSAAMAAEAAEVFANSGLLIHAADAYADARRLARRAGDGRLARLAELATTRILQRTGPLNTPMLATWSASEPLTPRESEVAALARGGASNREIAERLGISRRTAEAHLHRAYTKLGVSVRSDL